MKFLVTCKRVPNPEHKLKIGGGQIDLAAARNDLDVIAIPGMGTGLGGVDPADAARAMVDELRAHRQPKPLTVYLVDIDDEILMCLEEALRLAVG